MDLREGCFAGIDRVLNEMVRAQDVICIQPKDEASRIYFWNEAKLAQPVDSDITALWAAVRVPQSEDSLDAELVKCMRWDES